MHTRNSERTSIGRYEGMDLDLDLDLKGGATEVEAGRGARGVGGLEVGRAISEPSVAQWLTGAIQPTASASVVSGLSIVSTYNLTGVCLTQLAKYRLVLPVIRISNGRSCHCYSLLLTFQKRFAASAISLFAQIPFSAHSISECNFLVNKLNTLA